METNFPEAKMNYLKPVDFQNNPTRLVFQGFEYVANEGNDYQGLTWEENLQYCIPYCYPEWAVDPKTGTQRQGRDGEPFRNRNWKDEYPQGYSIRYIFEEGVLETGSGPLWATFCQVAPQQGQEITLERVGEKTSTKWMIRKRSQEPSDLPI